MNRNDLLHHDPLIHEIEIHETVERYFDSSLSVISRVEEFVFSLRTLLFGAGFLAFLTYELVHFARFLIGTSAPGSELPSSFISTDILIKIGLTLWILVVSSLLFGFVAKWLIYRKRATKMFEMIEELWDYHQQQKRSEGKEAAEKSSF